MNSTTFNIYNASAGSGKTYTIVKEYLKICFSSTYKEPYKHILAITFTNKAVAEMKERIINTLKTFATEAILESSDDMFLELCKELNIEAKTLHQKSKTLLNNIVHNYAAFDISTIDKFTQKLIRTFAFDLQIPINFEVELDTDMLLKEAVDALIANAGKDKILTKVLVDFAIEKADDDKSWDVSYDFNKIAQLLVSENDIPFISALKNKTPEDFKALKNTLKQYIISSERTIVEKSNDVLTLIEECGLQYNDFSGSYLPKHFNNLANKKFNINFEAKWQEDIENKVLYPKRVENNIASVIEEIQSQLTSAFNETKALVFQYRFFNVFYKNVTPLSVISAINKEINIIKQDRNLILISEFNAIISEQIKDQPTPFIYERIGEKFKHYFIDEFQDTSVLQWENLIPLLDNSLSGEQTSVTLVGDAKQAIYRWRGGKAEQFIGLYEHDNPFFIEKQNKQLPNNYRSYSQIVNFNNQFFKTLSGFAFSDSVYENLYQQSSQNIKKDKEGYVNISFLNIEKEDNKDLLYSQKVVETIEECLSNGFQLKDITILVRKKKEGVAIANYLTDEVGIDIISSETLLISNSPEVSFIINLLKFLFRPKDNEIKILLLKYLANHKFNITDKHHFYSAHINLEIKILFDKLKDYGISFNYNEALQLPLYETIEAIIQSFHLVKASDAYVQFFLDVVLDYSQKHLSSILDFVDYFESKKDSLSIVSPEGNNAIQIMTIHKAKGLEFPIVIFPYADLDIYREREPKEWLPINPEDYNGFTNAFLNYSKDFENYGDHGQQIYEKHQAELELDNINLLYVALTRAIEQLFIISSRPSKEGNLKLYSGLFINYLKHIGEWNDNTTSFCFGSSKKESVSEKSFNNTIEQKLFISTPKKDHNIKIVTSSGYLWDTNQQEAIEKGNLIHHIMSKIKTEIDIDMTFNSFLNSGFINARQFQSLKKIVINIAQHPELKDYFNSNYTIYNEKDIITKTGVSLRPDRLVINDKNEVIIIDYKTGLSNPKYQEQLQDYQDALEDMGFIVIKKVLIYINDSLEIKEV
ncbi:DNA helicase UvrD [Flavobacteriaceae bacterium AU392]|nr:DNA helicase UvrD [Flavobacteriaceae bacterium]RKM84738.1 DNA helicase UvrD [Flavobacteriaceae bacterium AU392]